FTEDSPLKPSSPYAASKASQDSFVLSYVRTYGLNISITRCTNNYGAFQLPEKLIPKAIIRAMMGNKVPIYGDGMQIRDWLYVDDHCRAMDLVAEKGQKGEIYNVSAGNEIPNIEIIKIILSLLNKDDSLIEHVEDRKGHDIRYSLDSKKIREMGWKPQIEIKEGLNNTVKWYQENRNWWKKLIKFL
ncbi:dTDP-glucose 4,6-dehydratase, partial [mine drainage metagenome]